jgi:hypothetical protein
MNKLGSLPVDAHKEIGKFLNLREKIKLSQVSRVLHADIKDLAKKDKKTLNNKAKKFFHHLYQDYQELRESLPYNFFNFCLESKKDERNKYSFELDPYQEVFNFVVCNKRNRNFFTKIEMFLGENDNGNNVRVNVYNNVLVNTEFGERIQQENFHIILTPKEIKMKNSFLKKLMQLLGYYFIGIPDWYDDN